MTGLRLGRLLPWLGLALMLAVTYQLWNTEQYNADQDLQNEFDLQVQDVTARIKQHMLGYEQMLRGVRGLFAASVQVERNEFREYVSSLRLEKNYPGIQGVGFLPLVTPYQKARHTAAVRREGFPEYTIKPEGERDSYTPITYLEPFSGLNLRAFGFDRYSESTRRQGMDQARDLDEAVISGKVKLAIETSQNAQAGFLMNLPVYKNGMPHETLADRRANSIGWVTATFRMGDLMESTLSKIGAGLDVDIFDGEKVAQESLMLDRDNLLSADLPAPRYQASSVMQIAGRPWTVWIRSLPEFDARLNRKRARTVAISGTTVSLLLFLFFWSVVSNREKIMRMASHLTKSEANLRAILDNSPYMAWLKDTEGRYIKVNKTYADYVRLKDAQQAIGKTDFDFWPKELTEKYRADDAEVMASRQQKCVEEPSLDGDRMHWVETFKTPVIDGNGNVLGTTGFARDITGRKQAEESLRKSSEEIEDLYNHAPCGYHSLDKDGVIQRINDTELAWLGYTRDEMIGKVKWPDLITPASQQAFRENFPRLKQHGFVRDLEFEIVRKDGTTFTGLINATAIYDPGGEFVMSRSSVFDITERKLAEDEIMHSNAELEQFGYAISHDMRQPLRMISSYLQLIEMKLADQLDSEKRGYLDIAIEGAKRIDQMMEALLEYSRVGRVGEPPAWIESRAMLDEALQFLQPATAEARARLSIAGDWPSILARHDEILSLLQNLIGNAAKFRVAGRTPEITVTGEVVGNEWHLSVADNGVGIIPEQTKRLFQMFKRQQSREAYAGTGIGLALCRKIAENHKGRIWAESAGEGHGSRFCVVLPVLRGGGGHRP